MKKNILYAVIVLIVIIIAVLLWWFFIRESNVSTFDSDTNIEGDYTVKEGEKLVLKDGSSLNVEGDLIVLGEIICENGPISLNVKGNTVIEGKLQCEGDKAGILIVAGKSFESTENSEIITNGSIQIVDDSNLLALTEKEIEEIYQETIQDSGEGNRIGPFSSDEDVSSNIIFKEVVKESDSVLERILSFFETPIAHAQLVEGNVRVNINEGTAKVGGEIKVNIPPRGTKQIFLMRFININEVTLENLIIIGPDGNNGKDEEKECRAEGGPGEDALRFNVRVPKLIINNFTLFLGSGGNGGKAIARASDKCKDVTAIGGKGGQAGNFKMIASQGFDITGTFTIQPGFSGNGGDAYAYAGDGGPNEDGGDATATGGQGADNNKTLRKFGTVNGTSNIKFGPLYGGYGGNAYAYGGKGGDGTPCTNDGGAGGDATAQAGKGGDAILTLTGTGAGRLEDDVDIGGDAGDVEAKPGKGGDGSDCGPDKPGGDGGKGGSAEVITESGGEGDIRGKDTEVINQTGGNGGDGGDGCPPGDGGKGGTGNPNGNPGVPGKNLCEEEKPKTPPQTEPEPEPEPEPFCGDGNCDEWECCVSCPEDCPICE